LAKVIDQGSEEWSRVMFIIGCDFHSRFQQIAMLDPATGEVIKRRLEHENGEAKKFYATLPSPARVGMEATCDAQWFERMLREHHHELPAIRGEAALDRKNPAEALHELQYAAGAIELGVIQFVSNNSCLYPTYIRGEAYLAAGQGKSAADEFQKILDHSGIVWNCWTGALAHLGLARANALRAKSAQGVDTDAARVRALAA
jgi:hypothetical protein